MKSYTRILAILTIFHSPFSTLHSSASTLSSDSIGTFFTLPTWMPTEVTSHDTPGSDPAEGGGWYVDEYTNSIPSGQWDIKVDGRTSEGALLFLADVPIYNFAYYEDDFNRRFNRVTSYEMNKCIPGDGTEVELDWTIWAKGYVLQEDEFETEITFSYHAERDVTPQPIPTGRRVPRAARLTPEVQAGVYSSFEGLYERMYYGSQGQSNVWDEAEYGDRSATTNFWFHAPQGHEIFTYCPTNREVRTRRLVEYDNIDGLADWLKDDFYWNGSKATAHRPGWCGKGTYDKSGWLWWSTTASPFPNKIVADFDSSRDPTYPIRASWGNCCMVFAKLESESTWKINSLLMDPSPSVHLMTNLSFGQPSDDYAPWWCRAAAGGRFNITMGEIIETNFPHAVGTAITNDTRRLVSSRLCCINQFLGLMDRTYHEPVSIYPTEGTNFVYNNEISYVGNAFGTFSWNSTERAYDFTATNIVWGSGSPTNYVIETRIDSSGQAHHYRISATHTNTGFEADTTSGAFVPDEETVRRVLDDLTSRATPGDGRFTLMIYCDGMTVSGGLSLKYSFFEDDPMGLEMTGEVSVPVSMTNGTIKVIFSYERNYQYERTNEQSDIGTSQPGFEAGARCYSMKYGSVFGIHKQVGSDRGLTPLQWIRSGSNASTAFYTSHESQYANRGDLVARANQMRTLGKSRFDADYGMNPQSWRQIIPINEADARRCRDSLRMTNSKVRIEKPDSNPFLVILGTYDSDGELFTIDTIYTLYVGLADFTIVEDYNALAIAYISTAETHDAPSTYERDPLAFDIKFGLLTQCDWNWNTLKRTDD